MKKEILHRLGFVFVLLIVLLLVLSACGPKISGELKTRQKTIVKEVEVIPEKEIFLEHNATDFVKQVMGEVKYEWGFDEKGNLVSLQKDNEIIKFYYKDNVLRKISNDEKSVELEYFDSWLSSASGDTKLPLHYVVKDGLLMSADDYSFTYGRDNKLWIYREGLGASLTFYYDEGLLDFFKKGNIVTHFYFDDENKLKHIEEQNARHLIMGYGREDKLASFSGEFYGLGETFDYGKQRISIISNVNPVIFTGKDELAEKAFHLYLNCARIRKGITVFEPIAYVVINDYFNKSVYGYMLENFYCEWIQ
ncbi:hypothetical protein KY304_01375 [Candidatus Woesearchaeota archaeon]|nr:hypothetical protein [Candidatus Woesearchaeota archaeon]MBW2978744.1 hypothetical protein [Candidatus Woesearchaeota archaeon]